ncbi:helix-turn-helix transcriptional regulator [Pleomorphochaeta sp. DL1XJH-081]|uniref:helix-turn-helix transcriptional regulator n=1 Tax=Pleomorphochaeta sp. DL1XJH-081 TaxID=3409690 RepID=UPI003BB6B620
MVFGNGAPIQIRQEDSISVWVPIICSKNDLDSFNRDLEDSHIAKAVSQSIVAVVSPSVRIGSGLKSPQGIPVITTILTGCMQTIGRVLNLNAVYEHSPLFMGVSEKSPHPITMREREVLERIACGDSVKQIAYGMGLSQHTVITYKRNLYMKTGARSLQQLAIYAVLNSMLP